MIQIDKFSLTVGKKIILENYTTSFMPGQLMGLTGSNGSGKTTLLKTFAGLHAPYEGAIYINHINLKQLSPHAISKLCAYVPAEPSCYWPLTVAQILSMTTPETPTKISADLGILPLLHQNFQTLSSGEKARVLLAQALLRQTPILILDEITSHLDEESTQHIMGYLKNLTTQGKIILLSTHDKEAGYTYCDMLLEVGDRTLTTLKKAYPALKEVTP